MKPLRVAILGLTLSHPYAFAQYLTAQGHQIASVWDYLPHRAAAFAREYGAMAAGAPEEALSAGVDGVIVTSHTRDHVSHARAALARGIPTYVDKLMALEPAGARELLGAGAPLFAGSALRFLPGVAELASRVRRGEIGLPLTATGTVYHGMQAYLEPGQTWQDDPALSGGVLMNMGVHAVDLLVAVLGPDWHLVAADRSRRVHPGALSEDQAAILLRSGRGELATIQVVSGTERHFYGLAITGSLGDCRWQFPDPDQPIANIYGPLLDRFIQTIQTGIAPVEQTEMLAVVEILAAARRAAPL